MTSNQANKKLDQKDLDICKYLRANARMDLRTLSEQTSTPISTVYDRIARLRAHGMRTCSILHFLPLGLKYRTVLIIQSTQPDNTQGMLKKQPHVNTISRVRNGASFIVDAVFRSFLEHQQFIDALEGCIVKTHPVLAVILQEQVHCATAHY